MNAPPPGLFPLRVEDLCFGDGPTRLLDDIAFRIEGGGCTALLGPNGAGKTLLLRLCHGLLTPVSGRILWGELTPEQARPWQSMVFQLPALLHRSVRANVEYALALQHVPARERAARTEAVLEQCGLLPIAGRSARLLSGGERQKLALARAWVRRPQVLLMDEPTSELDPVATREIEDMIRRIVSQGVCVLMTTHDMSQARALADSVLFLEQGRLQAHLPAADFFAQTGTSTMHRFAEHPGRFL